METAIMVGIVVLYTLLALICLFSLYKVFMTISAMLKETIEEIKEENWDESEKETEAEKGSASDTDE